MSAALDDPALSIDEDEVAWPRRTARAVSNHYARSHRAHSQDRLNYSCFGIPVKGAGRFIKEQEQAHLSRALFARLSSAFVRRRRGFPFHRLQSPARPASP